jgi:hypothetical protein
MSSALQRIVDRLRDLPVLVFDSAWTLQTANQLGFALLGDWSDLSGRERNVVWRQFMGVAGRVVRDPGETAAFELELVADLHTAAGRWPEDREVRTLISELRAGSPRFAELWEARRAAPLISEHKVIEHPSIGRVELDCDALRADGTDLVLLVYSTPPGSRGAQALELLRVVGLQNLTPAAT